MRRSIFSLQLVLLHVANQRDAAPHVELRVDVMKVQLHRTLGDRKPARDMLAWQAVGHHLRDLNFARRQSRARPRRAWRTLAARTARDALANVRPSVMYDAYGLDDLRRCHLLQQHT